MGLREFLVPKGRQSKEGERDLPLRIYSGRQQIDRDRCMEVMNLEDITQTDCPNIPDSPGTFLLSTHLHSSSFLIFIYLFIYLRLHQNKMVLCFSITNSNNKATIQWWFVDLASSLLLLLLSRSPIATTQQPSPIILKLVERERAMAIRIHTHFWSEIGDGFMYFLITFVFLHIIA